MQIMKVQSNNYNTAFGAGNVTLKNINPNHFSKYDEIQRIAEEDKLDISIRKADDSKYLPKNDLYIVIAKQDVEQSVAGRGKFKLPVHGTSCAISKKNALAGELSEKLYEAVIKSVENLADTIEKHIGQKPKFLAYLKK